MLILCKQCHIVLYNIIDNMYTPKYIISKQGYIRQYNYFTDVCCCFCNYNIGFNTFTVCKECMLTQYFKEKKKLIFFYINSAQNNHHCFFCLKIISKLLFLDLELIEFKIL